MHTHKRLHWAHRLSAVILLCPVPRQSRLSVCMFIFAKQNKNKNKTLLSAAHPSFTMKRDRCCSNLTLFVSCFFPQRYKGYANVQRDYILRSLCLSDYPKRKIQCCQNGTIVSYVAFAISVGPCCVPFFWFTFPGSSISLQEPLPR